MATMTSQHNIYPLFFTLEHVNNGYILTARQVTGGVSDAGYCKEVVSEDKINARIGQLLHVEALSKERLFKRKLGSNSFGLNNN